jgi:hypothetical protein
MWDEYETDLLFLERGPDDSTTSEPLEVGYIAPWDVLVPRPEYGPNVYTIFKQGARIPLALFKKANGQVPQYWSDLPRP